MNNQNQKNTEKKEFPVWLGCLMLGGIAIFVCHTCFVIDRHNKATNEKIQLQKDISSASMEWVKRNKGGEDAVLKYNNCLDGSGEGIVLTRANCLELTNNKEFFDVVSNAIKNSSVGENIKKDYM